MKNMMLQNPIIVPKTVGGDATVKFGRAGGVANGTWWETGLKTNSDFQIAKENNINNGGILFKNNGGIDIGKKMTIPPYFAKRLADQAAAGNPAFETPDINITALSRPLGKDNTMIPGTVNVFSPMTIINDRGLALLKPDGSQLAVLETNGITSVTNSGNSDFNLSFSQNPGGKISNFNVNGNLMVGNDLYVKGNKINSSINKVYGPILLIPEPITAEEKANEQNLKKTSFLINGLPVLFPDKTTKTFTINENLKKYAMFTLYYGKNFDSDIHDEKDIYYKYNNFSKILESYNKRIVEKITIDNDKIIFNYNPNIIKDRNDTRILYIHAQWWD